MAIMAAAQLRTNAGLVPARMKGDKFFRGLAMDSLGDDLKHRLGVRKAKTQHNFLSSDGVMLIMGASEREGLARSSHDMYKD